MRLVLDHLQNGGGRPGSIHHMGDVIVDRGREGPSIEKKHEAFFGSVLELQSFVE